MTVFLMGYSVSKKSWQGEQFVYVKTEKVERGIASVKEAIVSGAILAEKRLTNSSQKIFLQSSEVSEKDGVIEFYLGHFLISLKNDDFVLACQKYHMVDLVFEAQGLSFHGHTPQMTLKSKCQFSMEEPLKMGPFFLPKKRILASPINQELFRDKQGTLMFSHVAVQWPSKWLLTQMRFIDKDTDGYFTITFSSNEEKDFLTLNLMK